MNKRKWLVVIIINVLLIAGLGFLFTKRYIGIVKQDDYQLWSVFIKQKHYEKKQKVLCEIEGKSVVGTIQFKSGEVVKQPTKDLSVQLDQGKVPQNQMVISYLSHHKMRELVCNQNNIIGRVWP